MRRQQLQRLLAASGTSGWSLVPPPGSDAMATKLVESVRMARRAGPLHIEQRVAGTDFQAAFRRALGPQAPSTDIILAVSHPETVGVVRARFEVVDACAQAILDQDRDSLLIGDPDASWGVVCQRWEEPGGATYEIESWR